ncbi:MAG: hypothetical protein IKR81_15825 [Victivallales bacterium]|nr:hypothetical protein [Victivallales bacterium]
MIDMSRVSGDKNIAVGEASAFGAGETHGISVFPHPLAPCGVAKRSGKAQKNQQVLSTSEALLLATFYAIFLLNVDLQKRKQALYYIQIMRV